MAVDAVKQTPCWSASVGSHQFRWFCPTPPHTPLQSILMLVNAVAILNNDRFLEKCTSACCWVVGMLLAGHLPCSAVAAYRQWAPMGADTWAHAWSDDPGPCVVHADGFGYSQMQSSNSLKMSVIGGIHAVHYFRGGRRCEGSTASSPSACAAGSAAAPAPPLWTTAGRGHVHDRPSSLLCAIVPALPLLTCLHPVSCPTPDMSSP
jgi:Yos1-like